jgi:threonine/homoserine/homoserine lactone efflux protein
MMPVATTPADWLQFGALGLLALVCVGCFAVAMYFARGLVRSLERMNVRMDRLAEAVLLIKDPGVRSYLEQLRSTSESEPATDTPRRF